MLLRKRKVKTFDPSLRGLAAVKQEYFMADIGRALGVSDGAITQWGADIPEKYLLQISQMTEIPLHILRPDYFEGYIPKDSIKPPRVPTVESVIEQRLKPGLPPPGMGGGFLIKHSTYGYMIGRWQGVTAGGHSHGFFSGVGHDPETGLVKAVTFLHEEVGNATGWVEIESDPSPSKKEE